MEIRLATLDDLESLCGLYNEFYAYNAGLQPDYYKAGKENGNYPRSVIADAGSDIFLAADGGAVVGFLHVREAQTPPFEAVVPHRYAEIIDLIVTAPHRKKGIGSRLTDAAKRWAKARNLDYVELFVLSGARGEILFYEHEDFVPVSHTMRCKL